MTGNDGESSHVPPLATPRMTVFPRAIVDRIQEFAGSHIQGRGSRGGRGRDRRLPSSTPLPEVEPSLQTPTLTSAAHTATRSIYSFPENVAWKPRGEEFLPFLEDWRLDSPSVVVSLPSNTKWGGFAYPSIFAPQTTEYGVAKAFNELPQFKQETLNFTGLFYKRSSKRKGSGVERGYYLEPYHRSQGALFGTLPPNAKIIFCHDPQQLPHEGLACYNRMVQTSIIPSTSGIILQYDGATSNNPTAPLTLGVILQHDGATSNNPTAPLTSTCNQFW